MSPYLVLESFLLCLESGLGFLKDLRQTFQLLFVDLFMMLNFLLVLDFLLQKLLCMFLLPITLNLLINILLNDFLLLELLIHSLKLLFVLSLLTFELAYLSIQAFNSRLILTNTKNHFLQILSLLLISYQSIV